MKKVKTRVYKGIVIYPIVELIIVNEYYPKGVVLLFKVGSPIPRDILPNSRSKTSPKDYLGTFEISLDNLLMSLAFGDKLPPISFLPINISQIDYFINKCIDRGRYTSTKILPYKEILPLTRTNN